MGVQWRKQKRNSVNYFILAIKEHTTVGIDLGSNHIKVVVTSITQEEGKKTFRVLGTGSADSLGIRRGYVEDPSEAGKQLAIALRAAEKSSGISIREAEIAIGEAGLAAMTGTGTVMVGRGDMEVSELDISKANEICESALPTSFTQNKHIIDRLALAPKIDGKTVSYGKPEGMKGIKLETKTMFIACLEPHLSAVAKTVEHNSVDIIDVTAGPIAASVVCLSKSQKMAGCVLADIGAQTTSLIVYEDNMPVSVEILPFGGQDITNDIALGLKISIEEAEGIKVGAVTQLNFSKKKLDDIIHARLSDIFELIEGHLKKIGRNKMLPAGIFLTGGGAKTAGIELFARDFLQLPAKVVAVPSGIPGKNLDASFAVAYGLCLLAASNDGRNDLGLKTTGSFIGNVKKLVEWFKQFLP